MDFEKMKQKIDAWFESPEGKASMERERKRIKRDAERKKQAWEFLESLSDEDYRELLHTFIKWEERFEEREYEKGKHKSSNLFNTIFSVISHNAEECDDDNMFFGGGSTYRGFEWKVFVGQGSFYTIEENGERIFTSS
jgi:hypothetical protein